MRSYHGLYSAAARKSPYWDAYLETLPRERLDSIHLRRLKATIQFAYNHVPMYREIYDKEKVQPGDIRTLDDYAKLVPTLDKATVLEFQGRNPPFRDTIVQGSEEYISLLYQTSGTTGTPLREPGHFADGWNQGTNLWWAHGVVPADIFYFAFGYGIFMGFWCMHNEALLLGAQVIAGGGADSRTRVRHIEQLRPTVLVSTPSYALHLAEVGREMGIDPRKSSIRFVGTAGEPGSAVASIRKAIETAWDAKALDVYGISDVWGCVSWQCPKYPDRLHFTEACGYPLVVDEEGQPVPSGRVGELVITSYRASLQPMIKYRTRDLVEWHREGCDCGRTWTWLRGGVLARADQMAIVKGTNVYPAAVQAIVGEMPDFSENLEIHITRAEATDVLLLRVEPLEHVPSAEYLGLQQQAETALRDRLRVRIPVELVPPRSLPRYEFKARRVIDHRVKEAQR